VRVWLDPRAQRSRKGAAGAAAQTGKTVSAAGGWLLPWPAGTPKKCSASAVEATANRGEALDHVLPLRPPGLGKTHHGPGDPEELGVAAAIHQCAGPGGPGDIVGLLISNLAAPRSCVHRMRSHRSQTGWPRSCSIRPWRTTALDLTVGRAGTPATRSVPGRRSPGVGATNQGRRLELTACVTASGLDPAAGVLWSARLQAIVGAGRRPAFNLELRRRRPPPRLGPALPRHARIAIRLFARVARMWPACAANPAIGPALGAEALSLHRVDTGALMPAPAPCWTSDAVTGYWTAAGGSTTPPPPHGSGAWRVRSP